MPPETEWLIEAVASLTLEAAFTDGTYFLDEIGIQWSWTDAANLQSAGPTTSWTVE